MGSETYQFGDFAVDAGARTLTDIENKSISLTPKAFDTLLYLLRHRGTVLDKEDLMNAVWPNTVVEENNLNQCISALRRAFKEERVEPRYIATIPGRGYRFIADVIANTVETDVHSSTVKRIAVLPFKPLVEEDRDPALEIGMADTLIARLSSAEIIVRPISSVRNYVDLDQDPLIAGRRLGVDSVVDGSIQRSGDQIRVTVRLITVATGIATWAGTFNERFTNIFAVQDAIAERVAGAFTLTLTGEEKNRLTRRYTENTLAYELFLRGRYHVDRLTPPEMKTGILYLQQALDLDPDYALAHVGLANALLRIPIAGEMPPHEFFPKAKAAAQRALDIDERLAEAHSALGWIIFWYDWNWRESENHFRRALELDPNNADSHLGYSHLLSNVGRHSEALTEVKRSRELDPLNLLANALEGQFLLYAGRNHEAVASLQKAVELEPNFWLARLISASAYIEQARFDEAVVEAERATELSGSTHAMALAACALAGLGRRTEAEITLGQVLKTAKDRYLPPYHIALTYNCLDEREEALAWLERGYQQRDPKMVFIYVEPKWNNLRDNPRFKDLIQRMGFGDSTLKTN